MPRLIFVNRFFFPDHSATSQILSDLAFHLAGAGRDVHVVTGTQIYDDPKASLPDREIINGVHVHRVASTRFGRGALLGRSIDYLSFYRSVRRSPDRDCAARRHHHRQNRPAAGFRRGHGGRAPPRRPAWSIGCKTSIRKPPSVLDVPFMRGPGSRRSRRAAQSLLAAGGGDRCRRRTHGPQSRSLGVAPARIHVIPNWCNDEDIKPIAPADNPLRQRLGLGRQIRLRLFGQSRPGSRIRHRARPPPNSFAATPALFS